MKKDRKKLGKLFEKLPTSPGVYIIKGKKGKILYVGKASSIKKRVSSYFNPSGYDFRRKGALLENLRDLDFITTQTEAEALLYEAKLIKETKPKYNIELKDDKSFPVVEIKKDEPFPRIFVTRGKRNNAKYFGPYTNAGLLREAMRMIRRIFPYRTCKNLPQKVCMDYNIGLCPGPCIGRADKEEYKKTIRNICMFLESKKRRLINELKIQMNEAAACRNFEEAAKLRDKIKALSRILNETKIKELPLELYQLKQLLELPTLPITIESFDVSNISGQEAVGSLVTFNKGLPYKSGYRRYRIKHIRGIDDYGMIKEVIRRRFRRIIYEKLSPPDLVIIDGGRAHVLCVKKELQSQNLENLPVIGIAKRFEQIHIPERNKPLILPKDSKILLFIQRVRDETHRFAISYHHKLRGRLTKISQIDIILGVGPKRKRALLNYFGSIENIKKAKPVDLLKVKTINRKVAGNIIQYFKNEK